MERNTLNMDYKEYKESNIRIGFVDKFMEIPGTRKESHTYTGKILGVAVSFDTYLAMGSYGPAGKHSVMCIYTDEISIDKHLPLNGFNSNACFHIGVAVDAAIADFAEKNGLTLCAKVNSWPNGVAVVTKFEPAIQTAYDEDTKERRKHIEYEKERREYIRQSKY